MAGNKNGVVINYPLSLTQLFCTGQYFTELYLTLPHYTEQGRTAYILTFPNQLAPVGRNNTIFKSRGYHASMSTISPQGMTESTKDSKVRQLVSTKFTTLNMVTMEFLKWYRPFWLVFTIWTLAASFVTFIGKFSEMLPKFFWWTGFRHLCYTSLYYTPPYFASLYFTTLNAAGLDGVKNYDNCYLSYAKPYTAEFGFTGHNSSALRYAWKLFTYFKGYYLKSTHTNFTSTSYSNKFSRVDANRLHLRSVNNRLVPFNGKTQLPTRTHSYPITDISPLSCWIDRGTNVKINRQFIIFTQGFRKSTIKTRDKAVSQNLIIHNGDSRSQSALNRASAAFRKFSAFFQGSKNISSWYVNLTIFSKQNRAFPFLRVITSYASSLPFFKGDGIAPKSMIQKWPSSFNRYIGRQNIIHLESFLSKYSSIALRICSDRLNPFRAFRDLNCFSVI